MGLICTLIVFIILKTTNLGIYAVAVQFAEVGNFVSIAMANTYLPVIVNKLKEGRKEFLEYYIFYVEKMLLLALVVMLVVVFGAPIAIYILYGKEYIGAISILHAYSLGNLFIFIGMAEGAYINVMQLQKEYMITTCIAAIANIILNFILISHLGSLGAAIASVIAYSIQSIWALFLLKDTRELRECLFKAFLFRNIRKRIKEMWLLKK